jgi:uncharacterized repeat protein (TIGR01451 family)
VRTQNSLFEKVIRLLVGTALVFNYSFSAVAPVLAQEVSTDTAPTPAIETPADSAANLPTDTNVSQDQSVTQDVSQGTSDGAPAPDSNVSTGDSQPGETAGEETKTEPTLTADLSSTDPSPPIENLLTPVAQPSASLSTDKGDYSPTEKATITGSNLLPLYQYTLEITAQDLSFSTQVLTDASGSFVYEYQLDGTFRPEYKAEVKDSSGTVVVATTFTDSLVIGCTPDAQGADDQPGQKDLTQMCVKSANSTDLGISWNWDDTSFSGNNTGDACSLYDTNGDGLADYSLCVGVNGSPLASWVYTTLYSCGNGSSEKCTQPIAQISNPNSTCTASVGAGITTPFNSGQDTIANCDVKLSDIGSGSGSLLDVCSFPSGSPNSDPSDCIIASTAPQTGTLDVVKVLSPSTNSGLFNLQINSTTFVTDIGNNGTTGPKVVTSGGNTFGETARTGTSLSNYTTTVSCKDSSNNVVLTSGTNPWTVNVGNNQDVTCTITNTLKTGSLTIHKQDQSGVAISGVSFAISGASSTSGSTDGSGNLVFSDIPTGSYTVTETVPTDYHWTSTSGNCTNANPASVTVTNAGQSCTFVNTRDNGTIELQKVWSGTAGQTTLNIGTSAGGTQTVSVQTGINGGAPLTTGVKTVNTGTYYVSETDGLTDYTSSLACTDDGNPVTPGTNNSLAVASNHAVVCTFTNTLKPTHLTLVKTITNDNGGSAAATEWTLSADGPTPISGATGASAVTNAIVGAGTYTLSESGGPSGYSASSWSCVKNGAAPVTGNSITLAVGDSATCTINNDDQAPTLTLIKTVTNDNGGNNQASEWTLSATGTGGFSGTGTQDASANKATLGPTAVKANVAYSLSESGPAGYTPGTWNCVGGSFATGAITLTEGQSATCTINNDDQFGRIIIDKVTNPSGDNQSFSFNLSDGPSSLDQSFDLADATTPHDSGIVLPGSGYNVSETIPGGWDQTSATCSDGSSVTNIDIAPGETVICTFTNTKLPTLTVTKVLIPENSQGLFNLKIDDTIYATDIGNSGTTGAQIVTIGSHTVSEVAGTGTDLSNYSTIIGGDCASDGSITLAAGENKTCTITNTEIPLKFEISKSNNTVSAQSPGSVVTYTITLHSTRTIDNVIVNDSLPAGFTYVSGSWNPKTLPEPNYSTNPGIWNIGTLGANSTLTLTYDVKIADSVTAGTYYNLAFASGCRVVNNECAPEIFAEAIDPGKFTEGLPNMVRSKVDVAVGLSVGGQVLGTSITQVLGVSTETGSNFLLWVIGLLVMLVFGVLMALFPKKFVSRKIFARSLVIVFALLALTSFTTSVSATGETVVQLATLPASTNNTDIKLSYNALDLGGATVSVQAYYKRPNEGNFSALGGPVIGNSGQISVQSIITSDDGTYEFKVEATGTSSDTSDTVSTKLDRISPDAPRDFKKERVAVGTYKISWKTPDDATINRVVIWKSESANFDANDSNKVAVVDSSANLEQSYFDNVDPSKNYFYVLKSVDEAGNSSNFEGDKVQITETIGASTSTTGATGTSAGQGSQAGQGQGTGGQILSAATESATPSASSISENQESQTTSSQASKWYIALAALAGIAVIFLVWKFVIRKK